MSYDEIMHMPFLLYCYLMVADTCCDPTGGYIDQVRHGQLLSAIYLSSGNVKKTDLGKFSPLELADYNGILSGKTQEELLQDRQKEKHKRIMAMFNIEGNNDGE